MRGTVPKERVHMTKGTVVDEEEVSEEVRSRWRLKATQRAARCSAYGESL